MPPAIRVENLGKRYRLGSRHSRTVGEVFQRATSRIFNYAGPRAQTSVKNSAHSNDADFWALRDVTFEVPTGVAIGVIGNNGAGKSTLLKILSRITTPTVGCAQLHGRVASLLEIGTGFHPELTGRENIYLNGAFLGMTKGDVARRFDEIVEFSEIDKFIDIPVKHYSSGMYVRLAFGVAANLDPDILIVDEVLAVGDAAFQEKCLGRMDRAGHEGRTVIFVSHNMAAVRRLTSECVALSNGRVVFHGPTEQCVERFLEQEGKRHAMKSAADVPRASWSGDRSVEITAAELYSPLRQQVRVGDDLSIEITVRGREDVRTYGFGLTLFAKDGSAFASAFSDPIGPIGVGESQKFQLTIRDPGLAPGRYWFSVGVIRNCGVLVDAIYDVLHFDVLADGRVPSGFSGWNHGWGHLRVPVSVSRVAPIEPLVAIETR